MILQRILEHKKSELRRKQSRGYLSELKNRIANGRPPLGFVKALESGRSTDSPALIAEVKRASPSQGLMRSEFVDQFDPLKIARTYQNHGASALSVLTDQEFFQGNLDDLAAIKDQIDLPALNKEFMIEEVQFYEARAYGADCVLLIVAALDRIQLQDLYAIAEGLDLNVLIETHDEHEVDTVLERLPDVQLMGINNRDLQTFSTDLSVTQRLAKRIPSDKLIVSESGIHKRDDVIRIHESGAKAMLVGESLIKADDIGAKVHELLGLSGEKVEEESKK
jgi:indole-3-glycerol phosphate synthase